MRTRLCLIALLVTLPLGAASVAADLGAAISGVFPIAGKAVPLPEGEWRLVADQRTPAAASPAKVGLRSAVLVRMSGDRVVAAITVHTNEEPLARSLPIAEDCKRGDVHLAVVLYETKSDGACIWINHVVSGLPSAGIDPLWHKVTASFGNGLPALWLEAGFWVGDRQDVLDIRYHFIPPEDIETRTIGWSESPWSPGNIGKSGPRRAAVDGLAGWIGTMAPLIDLGLHSRLAGYQPVAMPWSAPATDSGKALRLRQLDALLAAGAIEATAYATQRTAVEQESAPAELTQPNIFVRAGYKSLTYKVFSTLDSFVVNWIFLGSFYGSAGLSVINSVAHLVTYYGHEVAWSTFGASSEKAATWKVLPIGIDRPL